MFKKILDSLKQNKQVLIIDAFVITIAVFLALRFLIFPLRDDINAMRIIKTDNKNVLLEQNKILLRKGDLKSKTEKLSIAIPDKADTLKFGSSLQTMALKSGVLLKTMKFDEGGVDNKVESSASVEQLDLESLKSLDVLPAVDDTLDGSTVSKKQLKTVSYHINVISTEENFKRFLQSLETNLRLVDIVDLQLPVKAEKSTSSYTLELKTYYFSGT